MVKIIRGFGFYRLHSWHYIRLPRREVVYALDPEGITFEVSSLREFHHVRQAGNEYEFIASILAELRPDDVFFDIGADIGFVALQVARRVWQVVAFEPDPTHAVRVETNIGLNQMDNIQLIRWAVSDQAGEVQLHGSGLESYGASIFATRSAGIIRVPANTIDDALANSELPVPDVVKIDIEGAEILALRGMQPLLRAEQRPRVLFIEVYGLILERFGSSKDEVVDLVLRYGYRIGQQSMRKDEAHY